MNKKTKQVIASFLASTTVLTTSACASKVDCNIDKTHSHTYVTEEGYKRQIKSELEYVGDFYRKDEYNCLTKEEEIKYYGYKEALDENGNKINVKDKKMIVLIH